MPGTEKITLIGDYSIEEINAMSAEELEAAQDRNYFKPETAGPNRTVEVSLPEPKPEPARDVWAKQKSITSTDFTVPSGQICRLRKIQPEDLLRVGILDQVTRLEGLAEKLVHEAQGLPPEQVKLPSRAEFAELLQVINVVVPLAVADPKVWGDDEEIPEDFPNPIRVSEIDLGDRVAILNEALKGLKALDRFRHPR